MASGAPAVLKKTQVCCPASAAVSEDGGNRTAKRSPRRHVKWAWPHRVGAIGKPAAACLPARTSSCLRNTQGFPSNISSAQTANAALSPRPPNNTIHAPRVKAGNPPSGSSKFRRNASREAIHSEQSKPGRPFYHIWKYFPSPPLLSAKKLGRHEGKACDGSGGCGIIGDFS